MRKSIFATSLLIALSALAQQTTTVTPAAEQTAPAAPQSPTVQPAIPASTAPAPSIPAPSAAAPTTMDQVVDRAIAREHALMEMLKTRTPLVETYLQNLKLDNQRSEEHTSELQSRVDLVCRLLLEKKKE